MVVLKVTALASRGGNNWVVTVVARSLSAESAFSRRVLKVCSWSEVRLLLASLAL